MNMYANKVMSLAINNKYSLWYKNIISKALLRAQDRKTAIEVLGYVEAHHILPKSFNIGGEKDKMNLVYLTAKEHFVVHLLLCKMFVGQFKRKMLFAMAGICQKGKGQQRNFTSGEYELARKFHSSALRSHPSPKKGKPGPKHSDETKHKMSLSHKGKIKTENHRKALSESHKGKTKSPDHIKKMADTLSKKRWWRNDTTSIFCEVCPEGFEPGRISWKK